MMAGEAGYDRAAKPAGHGLTVFNVWYGDLMQRIYSIGERFGRIEAGVHNARQCRRGRSRPSAPDNVERCQLIPERFLRPIGRVDAWLPRRDPHEFLFADDQDPSAQGVPA
jgi:hypothetical protein